jgi:hypothetical protein
MSSGNSKMTKNISLMFENSPEINLKLSKAFLPFPKGSSIEYIYNGTEKIPFKERDPLYQHILIEEFIE